MACGEPSKAYVKQMEIAICQLCGGNMKSCSKQDGEVNYQKQVDPPPATFRTEEKIKISPVPHPKEFYTSNPIPLIVHTPLLEYRVTSEVRGKPSNHSGVYYLMNHGCMERSDVMEWVNKKKRMAKKGLPWVGDGNYLETHPEMLHFYGNTTHFFTKNPNKPYGDWPEPMPPYTQIIPEYRYDEQEQSDSQKKCKSSQEKKVAPLQVCIPLTVPSGRKDTNSKSTTATTTPVSTSQTKPECTGNKTETQSGGTASCLPVGGCPPPVKMMLCLPCPPPDCVAEAANSSSSYQASCPRSKPTDYTYRCESRELRGGNLYVCCQCNKRNGLQHDCPRTPCQGRPPCLVKPWPDCWPSGGCHGIDYSREKGYKRVDPCRNQRLLFDNKVCRPPGGGSKADCGGNMMVVVCPPPPCNN